MNKKQNWYKHIYQFAVIGVILFLVIRLLTDRFFTPDFEAYCPFGGLQALGSFLTMGSLSCSMTSTQIMTGIALFAGIVLFARLFCGYICPLGTISEWLGKLGDRLKIRREIGGVTDKVLRLLKYVLLFVTFYFTLQSSELFCKKFDPYYAAVSGFDSDVALLWAVAAIAVLVLGSMFFRLFWCRYLCPLGALSVIFRFSWWFAGVMALYIILLLTGLKMSYTVPLIVITAGGYLLETFYLNRVRPALVHITRNSDTCTSCGLCSERCPQGIDVAGMKRVTHADCTLCGDCLYACPEKETLRINNRNLRWLPAAALGLLIILGIAAGTMFELPTINQKWASAEQLAGAKLFEMSGLKNIKCYGSSVAFANQMRKTEGIHGVATYVASNTVHILYDPSLYDEEKIGKMIFVPEKRTIKPVAETSDSVAFYTITIDKFFDPYDALYLQHLLDQKTDAYGYQSDYACPVIVRIYFPSDKTPAVSELTGVIESKKLDFTSGGTLFSVKLPYRVISAGETPEVISSVDYLRSMFVPAGAHFNGYTGYSDSVISSYAVYMGDNSMQKDMYGHLISHISNDRGVTGFETRLDSAGRELGVFFFVDTLTTPSDILKAVNADSLLLHYSDGSAGKIANPFSFPEEGWIIKE